MLPLYYKENKSKIFHFLFFHFSMFVFHFLFFFFFSFQEIQYSASVYERQLVILVSLVIVITFLTLFTHLIVLNYLCSIIMFRPYPFFNIHFTSLKWMHGENSEAVSTPRSHLTTSHPQLDPLRKALQYWLWPLASFVLYEARTSGGHQILKQLLPDKSYSGDCDSPSSLRGSRQALGWVNTPCDPPCSFIHAH